MNDHAGLRSNAKERASLYSVGVASWYQTVFVIARAGRRNFVMQRPAGGHFYINTLPWVNFIRDANGEGICGGEFHKRDQALIVSGSLGG